MDTELLRTFVAVHEARSITRACRTLHCTQPAVSRRVAQLESLVGAPLFERVPSGMVLTAAGAELLPFAELALAAVRDGMEAVRGVRDEHAGPLAVALVGTLAGTWVTSALRRLAARHPRVDLRLRTATSAEAIELVRRGEVTFGIGHAEASEAGLVSEVVFEERMVVVCAASHPRARRRVGSLSELADERWLAFPERRPGPETSARRVSGTLAAAGVPEEAVTTIDSLTAQKRLVEAGLGIALMQLSAVAEERAAGTLETIGVRGLDLRMPVTITRRRDGYLSQAAAALLAELRRAGGRSARPRQPRARTR